MIFQVQVIIISQTLFILMASYCLNLSATCSCFLQLSYGCLLHWMISEILAVISSPASFAILFMNWLMTFTPTGCRENHTFALHQSLSLRKGERLGGPHVCSPAGRFEISISKQDTGQRGPPVHISFCTTGLGLLLRPPCLVFVGPSTYSTWEMWPVVAPLAAFRSSMRIWWCSCLPRVPKCWLKRRKTV